MEVAFLLVVAVSAGAGLVLRSRLGPGLGRVILVLGASSLAMALAVLGLAVAGWGPVGARTAGLAAVVLLGAAAVALPMGLASSWGRGSR